jgi:YD repeat-containing protein
MPQTSSPHDNDHETDYAYTTGGSSVIKRKNLLTTVTNPDSTTTGYTYNALSEVVTTTDPSVNIITNGYDAGGRVRARK